MFFATLFDAVRAGRQVDITLRVTNYLISFGPWVLVTPFFYNYLEKKQQKANFSVLAVFIMLLISWLTLS